MFPKTFSSDMSGLEVKQKIEQLGIPLAEVARRLDISPQSLQKKLNVEDIKVGVLREIASAVNKSVYFFFEEGSSMNVQAQVNEDRAKQNSQNMNTGNQGRNSPNARREVNYKNDDERIKEKDQIIADLRKTIALYEILLSNREK